MKLGKPIHVNQSSFSDTSVKLKVVKCADGPVVLVFAASAFRLIVDDDVDFVLLAIG